MPISTKDVVPMGQVRARFTELAEDVHSGNSEKVITRNGESYVALVDAKRLDHYHRLESESIHLLLLEEAAQGLADVTNGRISDVDALRAKYGR